MHFSKFGLLLGCSALAAGAQSTPPADPYGLANQKGALVITGRAVVHGAKQTFKLTFDRSFRYRLQVFGALPEIDGFDGKRAWTVGTGGVAHETYTFGRATSLLSVWAMIGLWTDPRAPVVLGHEPETIKTQDDDFQSELKLDPRSGVATAMSYRSPEGQRTWRFDSFKKFGGRVLPARSVLHAQSQDDEYDIESVTPAKAGGALFAMPDPDPSLFSYDAAVPPQVELKRALGHLFIRPKIDGQDVGWFFLDTGADVCCIDPVVAKQLGLKKVGSDATAGVVAVAQMGIDEAHTLQIGPATLKDPSFLELDLKSLTGAFGFPIAGICGYDLFARVVVDIDPALDTAAVYAPDQAPDVPKVRWESIRYSGNAPVVTARFSPHYEGQFHLDTGSNGTVDFFTPAVAKYLLADLKGLHKIQTGGAGGSVDSLEGPIDWFELGGYRFEKPSVGIQLAQTGVYGMASEDGNIGMAFLDHFHLIFDYPHGRVGFVPNRER